MQRTMDETQRRREKQVKYNTEHHITPTTVTKSIEQIIGQTSVLEIKGSESYKAYALKDEVSMAAEEIAKDYESVKELEKEINAVKKMMEKAAKDLDFIEAARLRDKMLDLKKRLG